MSCDSPFPISLLCTQHDPLCVEDQEGKNLTTTSTTLTKLCEWCSYKPGFNYKGLVEASSRFSTANNTARTRTHIWK